MSDCDQKDCESEERIRAASPPRMEVREEDATDVFDVDQHRSSPDLFGERYLVFVSLVLVYQYSDLRLI